LLNANGKLDLRLNDGGTFCAWARDVARKESRTTFTTLVEGTK
jgi:hypothetical protein